MSESVPAIFANHQFAPNLPIWKKKKPTSQAFDIDNCIRSGFGQSNKLVFIIIMIVIMLSIHQLLSFCTLQGSKNSCNVTNTEPVCVSEKTQKEQNGKQGDI